MLIPFCRHSPPAFDVLEQTRLSFHVEEHPPLTFFQCAADGGLFHVQITAYEAPRKDSKIKAAFWNDLGPMFFASFPWSQEGAPLVFPPSLLPPPQIISGEDLVGVYWACRFALPYEGPLRSFHGITGLFHGEDPLCFLEDSPPAPPCGIPVASFSCPGAERFS